MRFYYISIISVMLLAAIYLVGTAVLGFCGVWLRKRWKRAWIVMVPLFLLLYAAPVAEEFWIAWNFGQLCKKDAGIFVYKTVEVEGFYDTTVELRSFNNPALPVTADYYDKGGFQFYELSLLDDRNRPTRVVHYEKVNGVWTPAVLDHPTAKYHYRWPHMNTSIERGIQKTEWAVIDSQTQEVLGRYIDYGRSASWFFIALDRPLMFCKEAENDARARGTLFGPRMVLLPTQSQRNTEAK